MFSLATIIHNDLKMAGYPIHGVGYDWPSNTLTIDFNDGATQQQIDDATNAAQAIIANRDALKEAWQP